jgi:integrase
MATVVIQKRERQNRNSYVIHYKDPSTAKTKYYRTFKRFKDAQQAANELRNLIDLGKILGIQKNKTKLNLLTFSEVAELLKQEWHKRVNQGKLKEKTFEEYVYQLNVLNRIFGKQLLCKILKDEILRYQANVASEFSNVTSNRRVFIIKHVFKHGLEIRAVLDDSVVQIKYLSEKEQERNKFLLPLDLDRIIEASQETRGKFYMPALIYLGAEHGASRQEALSLNWRDIDFDYNGQGMIRFFRTKNSRERTEYLMPRTKEALLKWQEHQRWMRHRKKIDHYGSDFVFCTLNGIPIKRFDKVWRATCGIVGVKDFHYHDLRHTFCSNVLLSGGDLKDVKEMIGHNDLSMTDRYSHLTLNHKRLRQDKLAEHYANGREWGTHMVHKG